MNVPRAEALVEGSIQTGRQPPTVVAGTAAMKDLWGTRYRDPLGFDVHVAQSDVATCEVVIRRRAHRFAAWNEPRRLVDALAAVELHHPEPLPGVRYVGWESTTPGSA